MYSIPAQKLDSTELCPSVTKQILGDRLMSPRRCLMAKAEDSSKWRLPLDEEFSQRHSMEAHESSSLVVQEIHQYCDLVIEAKMNQNTDRCCKASDRGKWIRDGIL